jgi:transcriptional regulator with XRE-family HTH domain
MQRGRMRFGDFLRKKRLSDSRALRQADIAKLLGISLSLYTEIENNNRRTLNSDEIEIIAQYLGLSEEDKVKMYDYASYETGQIPADLDEIFKFDKVGGYALMALREYKAGNIDEEMWKKFIRDIEEKKDQQRERGEINDKDENNES